MQISPTYDVMIEFKRDEGLTVTAPLRMNISVNLNFLFYCLW